MTLVGCVYVNKVETGPQSHAFPPVDDSLLGELLRPRGSQDRAMVIDDPSLALTSRLDLIEAAESSIDLQYFIWQNDATGILVIEKLLRAADRVVGYNIKGFDYEVLRGYTDEDLQKLPTFDMMYDLEDRLGFRPKLESVAVRVPGVQAQ